MTRYISMLCLLLLTGCVTHYHTPPQTVVYRDVHGLTSGVYDHRPERVYYSPSLAYSSTAYYPWWSIDYFYLQGGYRYGYHDSFSFSYSSGGPYFGISWSSGYRYPGPWYGFRDPWYGFYDPWYGAPWRYGWYAPYRPYHPYRGYRDRHYAGNPGHWRDGYDRHDRYDRSGYRERDDRGDQRNGGRRGTATLDPEWRRDNDGLRQGWRPGPAGEDREIPGSRGPAPSTAYRSVPSSTPGAQPGMTVRSRSDAKPGQTRAHVVPGTRTTRDEQRAEPSPARSIRYISGSNPAQKASVSSEVRSRQGAKQVPTRTHESARTPYDRYAPVAPAPGRFVSPPKSVAQQPQSAPSTWQPPSGQFSRQAPVSRAPDRGYSSRPPASERPTQRTESGRASRPEKTTSGSRRGGDKER